MTHPSRVAAIVREKYAPAKKSQKTLWLTPLVNKLLVEWRPDPLDGLPVLRAIHDSEEYLRRKKDRRNSAPEENPTNPPNADHLGYRPLKFNNSISLNDDQEYDSEIGARGGLEDCRPVGGMSRFEKDLMDVFPDPRLREIAKAIIGRAFRMSRSKLVFEGDLHDKCLSELWEIVYGMGEDSFITAATDSGIRAFARTITTKLVRARRAQGNLGFTDVPGEAWLKAQSAESDIGDDENASVFTEHQYIQEGQARKTTDLAVRVQWFGTAKQTTFVRNGLRCYTYMSVCEEHERNPPHQPRLETCPRPLDWGLWAEPPSWMKYGDRGSYGAAQGKSLLGYPEGVYAATQAVWCRWMIDAGLLSIPCLIDQPHPEYAFWPLTTVDELYYATEVVWRQWMLRSSTPPISRHWSACYARSTRKLLRAFRAPAPLVVSSSSHRGLAA
jgi:hypothetical protein